MPGRETFAVAFQSILANKLRAGLTMLGIVIGVAAVVAMVAVGTGAQRAVEAQIAALGARLLSIYPGQSYHRGVARAERVSLTSDDAEALRLGAELLDAVVPEIHRSLPLKLGAKNVNAVVVGTTPDYPDVHNFELAEGRVFTAGEAAARRRVAVLGSAVPGMLDAEPMGVLGHTLFVRGIPFEVIGVFEPRGAGGSWRNLDEQILIPLETAQLRVVGSDRLQSITVRVAEDVPLEQGMVSVERVLRREHGIRPGRDNDFRLRNRQEIQSTQQAATQVFTVLLGSIAGVSLLVGGIGIMNIMLVSVTERTREIGVRKALGATRRAILLQFLVEAVVLCLVGGLLGIALGAGGAFALSELAGWNTFVSPVAVAVAFLFSAAVGIGFGLWPARRAAGLDPIEALRSE